MLGRMAEIDMARSIFSAWDHTEKGYLTIEELGEEVVTLGLSTGGNFVECLMYSIKARRSKKTKPKTDASEDPELIEEPLVNTELLTLKDFLKVFSFDKFGDKVCKVINQEFNETMSRDLQKVAAARMAAENREREIDKTTLSLTSSAQSPMFTLSMTKKLQQKLTVQTVSILENINETQKFDS